MKKILVTGCFNVIHPGHLRLLRFAHQISARLVVGVESDRIAGNKAHVQERLRLEGVQCLGWVSEAFIYDEPVKDLILRLKPDIMVKGKEHEDGFNPELQFLQSYGGILIFSSGESGLSSIDLIRKEFASTDKIMWEKQEEFTLRHNLSRERLTDIIHQFSNISVCSIGDIIVDEYISCRALGMSQEDPTLVVTPLDSNKFLGGAGIVAAHAAGLGARSHFLSVAGDDAAGMFALSQLGLIGVRHEIMIDGERPTTLKQRYRSQSKTLLRVSRLQHRAISKHLQNSIFERFEALAPAINLLVFSDFNYGCLPQSLVDRIVKICQLNGIKMVADSQSSSQTGNIGRFNGMHLLTPTEHEARVSTRNHDDGLVVLARNLTTYSASENILLKLGDEGVLVYTAQSPSGEWTTDRISPMNRSPKDVSGAGDSLLITSAMVLACGGNIWEAAYLGSVAAAVQVSRVGNIPLHQDEIIGVLG